MKQFLQFSIDFEEEKAQSDWSTLYQALENLEKLFSSATVGAQVVSNAKNAQDLIPQLMLIALQHKTYWIRLGVQRIFGAIFSLQMKNNLDISKCLGISEPKELVDYLFKLMNVFKYGPMLTEELGT